MTLKQQLIILLFTLFVFLFLGTFGLSVHNSYRFIGEQLSSHAQDTATSLGLSLSQVMAQGDETTLARMVDAIFDSGYYRTITVSNVDGSPILTRKQELKVFGVPKWFIQFIPLKTPAKTAEIMTGWKRAGVVKVTSNPGYAYADLWQSSKNTFILFLTASIIAILIGLFVLHFMLKPLKAICFQAEAICQREFPILKSLPFTDDLRTVVKAMNRLSTKIKNMFEAEAARTEQYRQEAFSDPVTGLSNRRFMMQELAHILKGGRDILQGALIHVEVFEFKAYNDKWGFEAGNQLLNHIANTLKNSIASYKDSTIAKMQGGGFTMLVPHITRDLLKIILTNISKDFHEYKARGATDAEDVAHLGAAMFAHGDTAKALLSNADLALRKAQLIGANAYEIFAQEAPVTGLGMTYYSELLQDVITTESALMHYQQVYKVDNNNNTNFIHNEAFLRIKTDDDELLSAGAFWPMAERLNLTCNLDLLALKLVLKDMQLRPQDNFSLNISVKSLHEETFIHDMYAILSDNTKLAKRLSIELSEYNVVRNIELIKDFAERILPLGVSLVIDHFGQQFDSVRYLQTIKPDYIKIDGAFIRNLVEMPHNQQYIASIAKMAKGLDIVVICETVETQDELDILIKLGVDGAQGYLLAKPMPIL